MSPSLWGEKFDLPDSKLKSKKVIDKVTKTKKPLTVEKAIKSKVVSNEEKIALIEANVNSVLGKFKDNTEVIYTKDKLHQYIDAAISNNIIAIDTETNNSLDPITCKLMGACIYTYNQKQIYIPINHVDNKGIRLENQLTEKDIKEEFNRLADTKIIMHNAKFDIKVLKCTCDCYLKCYWDTSLACRILDENESAGLKSQYLLHIDSEAEKYDIEHLFEKMPYEIFSPELFALYAATDAYKTLMLYDYQYSELNKEENADSFRVFKEIEMPCIDVLVSMELEGIEIDSDYAKKVSEYYHSELDKIDNEINEELNNNIKPLIDKWRLTKEANFKESTIDKNGNTKYKKSKSEQLQDPPMLSSSTQMAIILYDVLKVGIIDKSSPRGTGAEIIEQLSDKINLCKLLLAKRKIDILLNTFVDNIPNMVNKKTGRLHGSFNQYGAKTGRFSSSDPNLQNIPSHEKIVRMIFTARTDRDEKYSIVGSDFSAQEPRSLASFSKDEAMLKAYDDNKDLYAIIGSKCFHNNYEDNLEFHPLTGVKQPDGKIRRDKAKTVLLGITYGMGSKTLADRLGTPIKEAEEIINSFYEGFKGVDKFTKDSQEMLKKYGYVTDIWGRRRHIPDATLPAYEVISRNSIKSDNPMLGITRHIDLKSIKESADILKQLLNAKNSFEEKQIISKADSLGYTVKSNKGFISRSLRQCLNARIQGTAASMTKRAMILIHNDELLNSLGFKLLITVHDEVFGECPTRNAEAASKRLSELMVAAAKPECCCKFKCDPYVVSRWYEDEVYAKVIKDYKKLVESDASTAKDKIKKLYPMIKEEYLMKMCEESYEINSNVDI